MLQRGSGEIVGRVAGKLERGDREVLVRLQGNCGYIVVRLWQSCGEDVARG